MNHKLTIYCKMLKECKNCMVISGENVVPQNSVMVVDMKQKKCKEDSAQLRRIKK